MNCQEELHAQISGFCLSSNNQDNNTILNTCLVIHNYEENVTIISYGGY